MTLMKVDQNHLLPNIANIWEDFFGRDITELPSWKTGFSVPAVNIEEHPNEFVVSLAAPGLKKDNFNINLDNGILTISSEKQEKHKEKQDKFTRREFSYESFRRSFTLPDAIKEDQIEAKYADGILTVHLPKKEGNKVQPSRHIEIK